MTDKIIERLGKIFQAHNGLVDKGEPETNQIVSLLGALKELQGFIEGYREGEKLNNKENL